MACGGCLDSPPRWRQSPWPVRRKAAPLMKGSAEPSGSVSTGSHGYCYPSCPGAFRALWVIQSAPASAVPCRQVCRSHFFRLKPHVLHLFYFHFRGALLPYQALWQRQQEKAGRPGWGRGGGAAVMGGGSYSGAGRGRPRCWSRLWGLLDFSFGILRLSVFGVLMFSCSPVR